MSFAGKLGLGAIALVCAMNTTVASAAAKTVTIDVTKLKPLIVTTIADVKKNADGSVIVRANNDARIIVIPKENTTAIADAENAKKNGFEVRIGLAEGKDANEGAYVVTKLNIVSYKNVLTNGFDRPDKEFSPIVASTEQEAQDLFNLPYPYKADNYDVNDNCYNRAQYWARMHQVAQKRLGKPKGTDKVFIFFTDAYIQKFKHKWWFHVAPVIYVGSKANPYALDPTFLDEAVSVKEWLSSFDHHTHGQCVKIDTMNQFYAISDKPVCAYIIAPMFNYSPSDLNEQKLTNWRCSDFKRLQSMIPAPGALSSNRSAKWSDTDNSVLVPKWCSDPSAEDDVGPVVVDPDTNTEPTTDFTTVRPTATKWVGRIKSSDGIANLRNAPTTAGNTPIASIKSGVLVNLKSYGDDGWYEVIVPAGAATLTDGLVNREPLEGYVNMGLIERLN